jgi:hypothetical protein
MDKTFTHLQLHYLHVNGKERTSAMDNNPYDHETRWLVDKINDLERLTPEIPDRVLKRIMSEAKF